MDALTAIAARRSIGRLSAPAPEGTDLDAILGAGATAPDHGELRPFRFQLLRGAALDAFGTVLEAAYVARCAAVGAAPVTAKAEKERSKLHRAPLVIVVSAIRQPSEKIPWLEQQQAAAAACQNVLLAATALGFGSMWRTGEPVYDEVVKEALGLGPKDAIAGFLYLGTIPGDATARKAPRSADLHGLVSDWTPVTAAGVLAPRVSRRPRWTRVHHDDGRRSMSDAALPAHERPIDDTPVHTEDLPPTPIRDRNVPITAWIEAPLEALRLGDDIGAPETTYKRRIGPWLLWRAGPASKADARYLALLADDLAVQHTFRIFPDGTGEGAGPSGETHVRFRTWKQDLKGHRPDGPVGGV